MAVYLEILEGKSPETAQPVLVTRDPEILQAVADALRARVTQAADRDSPRAALEVVTADIGTDEGDEAHGG